MCDDTQNRGRKTEKGMLRGMLMGMRSGAGDYLASVIPPDRFPRSLPPVVLRCLMQRSPVALDVYGSGFRFPYLPVRQDAPTTGEGGGRILRQGR